MKAFAILSILMLISAPALGRVFTKCELAQDLYNFGFEMSALPEWVCLVNAESSMNTTAIGGPNTNGSFDWGLFQINDGYWCVVGGVGKDCNIDCNKLIDDDITDDVACVKIIYNRHGFTAWHGWTNKCQTDVPSVDECF